MSKSNGKKVSKQAEVINVSFHFKNETPGTFRYEEDGAPKDFKIGSLYVKKTAAPETPPKKAEVQITFR